MNPFGLIVAFRDGSPNRSTCSTCACFSQHVFSLTADVTQAEKRKEENPKRSSSKQQQSARRIFIRVLIFGANSRKNFRNRCGKVLTYRVGKLSFAGSCAVPEIGACGGGKDCASLVNFLRGMVVIKSDRYQC